ncbi:hypothetical protein SDRG_13848 [Saprolegnia diclina VS20]|uniref:Uncharacterized protein n=1 Tax=Saprolegnia diclina (strain VS20) TaxID=1156394 RepID=T0Q538_SAPDV|nr:hypothetical protein SDRG_13848 [Saprolegnia diclina VS20]EQC28520.1 hypothetical protein SDRG_13848 [Saprolegnia diclina VS20]|eukprot:XP_008618168.1 hypothetical protein SDRG_13848 [Saprolegnia diclina VS20]
MLSLRRLHPLLLHRTFASSARPLLDIYQEAVTKQEIRADAVQVKALVHLQRLQDEVLDMDLSTPAAIAIEEPTSMFSAWFGAKEARVPEKKASPKGVYMHGGVGCGKTFLMDMFYDNLPIESKRRVHFHKFMLEVHEKMHTLRKAGLHEDPIPHITKELVATSRVICFDEFQVTDVADALILRRLFSAMIEAGSIVVATSNRPPTDLYKNGLQRDLFLPFIALLQETSVVHSLDESSTDYRKLKGEDEVEHVYRQPLTEANRRLFYEHFKLFTKGDAIEPVKLHTQGRTVNVEHAAIREKVCQVTFSELCDKPLGAADYLALGEAFDTVFVQDIPLLDISNRNTTRRFITFVDCMYEKKVQLYCLADALPMHLLVQNPESKSVLDEAFAFDRTVSRLLEMQSEEYVTKAIDAQKPDRFELLETLRVKEILYDDVKRLWNGYNTNANGFLEQHEMRVLLEDINELHDGSRDVPPQVLEEIFREYTKKVPRLTFPQFQAFWKAKGLTKWW